MLKRFTAAAIVGAMSLATVPALTSAAFAQTAAPEPPQGAQPMDNPGSGSMEKSDGMKKKSSMKKSSMKKMKKSKKM